MKNFYYNKIYPIKDRIKCAFNHFFLRLRYPIWYCYVSNWNNGFHEHICLAARLLRKEVFEEVCPCKGKIEDLECSEDCDYCDYMARIDFETIENKKVVRFFIKDKILI